MGLAAAIRREAIYISTIARTLWLLRRSSRMPAAASSTSWKRRRGERPEMSAIYCADQAMSYAELDARANRYAHWAMSQGIGQGSVVALLMENRPDYIAAWLGLFKVGRAGGADQHQPDRRGAGAFHRHLRRAPCDRGRRAGGAFREAPFETGAGAVDRRRGRQPDRGAGSRRPSQPSGRSRAQA